MNKSVEDLIAKTGGVPFGVNDWGSCQYTDALNIFNALELLTKKHGKEEAFKMLHLRASHKGVIPIKTAWASFRREILDQGREMNYTKIEVNAITSWFQKTPPSVDAMFTFCREHSWDLWGAAPFIAEFIFKDLVVDADSAPGAGPIMNVAVQSETYKVGLCCWLLWNEGLVTDSPEKVYGGFDT